MSWPARAASMAARTADWSGLLGGLERIARGPNHVLRVLTYHRIVAPDESLHYPGVVSATPEAFGRQMLALASRYRVIGLEELLSAIHRGESLPDRAVLVTFDDAYRDFASHAWPVLRRLGLPVTVFVPTGFPGDPGRAFWWDRLFEAVVGTARREALETSIGSLELADADARLRSFRRVQMRVKTSPHHAAMELVEEVCGALERRPPRSQVLPWDSLRSLKAEGVTFCAHTVNHPLLDCIGPEQVRAEVVGSLADLRRELGGVLPVLAYPDGRFGADAVRVLAEEGVELAFTTRRGVNDLRRSHPLLLRRIPVTRNTSNPVLRAQLLGFLSTFDRPLAPLHGSLGRHRRLLETE